MRGGWMVKKGKILSTQLLMTSTVLCISLETRIHYLAVVFIFVKIQKLLIYGLKDLKICHTQWVEQESNETLSNIDRTFVGWSGMHAWNHPETFHLRYGKFNLCNFKFDEKKSILSNHVNKTLVVISHKINFFVK